MVLSNHHRTNHARALVEMNFVLATLGRDDIKGNVHKLHDALIEIGLDEQLDGFWILPINRVKETFAESFELFSPSLIKSLKAEVEGFPMIAKSWMDRIYPEYVASAVSAFHAHLNDEKNEYYLPVKYRCDDGSSVKLICQGTIVNREDPENMYMIGTHEIIE